MTFSGSRVTFDAANEDTVTVLSPAQREQAVQGAQLTEVVQSLYSLCLYDTLTEDVLTASEVPLDPAGRTDRAEYFFRVPPKVHEMGEQFVTTVTPTQDGGKFVESYGSITKSVRLTGTTGLRPNKVAPTSTVPLLGVSDQQLNRLLGTDVNTDRRSIPATEHTGHDDIIFLRNVFRKYSDLKKSDDLAGRTLMLWRNLKDGDYWVVEPEDFRLTQSSNSPLTYEYSITLKTLSRFLFTYSHAEDPLAAARSRQRMLARLQEYGQNILDIFLTLSSQLTRLQGYATFISNTVLAPMLNVVNGLNAVKTSAYGVVRGLHVQAITLNENVMTAINELTREMPPIDLSTQLPSNSYRALRELKRLLLLMAELLAEPVANESVGGDVQSGLDRYATAYERPGTSNLPRRAPTSSPSYIGYERPPNAVGSDLVRPGEDLRDIAARLLGDPNRWRILAVLNRLRAPFVAPVGSPGILAPGDSILFPRPVSRVDGGLVGSQRQSNNERDNSGTSQNTPVDHAYGRDIMLRSVTVGGIEYTDLAINQRGDLATISGVPNLVQALRIKFMTSRGELRAHPRFGAKYGTGRKATPASFNELRINVMTTLLSDTRVKSVPDLRFVAVGDKLAVVADVAVTNSSDVLQTSFALRRF